MRSEFDPYVRGASPIHRLDPRVKLLFVVEASLILFLWPYVWMAVALILLCTAGFWLARIPAGRVTGTWRMMAPLVLMVFGLTAIFGGSSGPAWLRAGPLAVTPASANQGAMLGLRLLALALIVYLWLSTTDQATLLRGFQALHVPYTWALTLALALRYLPIFAGLFTQVREAQQARGLDLEQRGMLKRLQAYRPVLVAMVIGALRHSERLGWALEARALGLQGVRRTVFRPLHLGRRDYAALLLLGTALAVSLLLRPL